MLFTGLPASFAERKRRAIARARSLGWTATADDGSTGTYITISKTGFDGFITIFRRPASYCGGMTAWKCYTKRNVDVLQVTRGR